MWNEYILCTCLKLFSELTSLVFCSIKIDGTAGIWEYTLKGFTLKKKQQILACFNVWFILWKVLQTCIVDKYKYKELIFDSDMKV